jgi:4'-phosphopantetheinyl transferase
MSRYKTISDSGQRHSDGEWHLPSDKRVLGDDEVDVWRLSLDPLGSMVSELRARLSAEENDRAEKFKFQKDRKRYILTHGLLRVILRLYADVAPEELKFTENRYGKPELVHPSGLNLRFNLSHSHERALIGIACGRQIGVDIEYVKRDFDWQQIIERFFSPREIQMINALPKDLQHRAFFTCWTRKEAYVKATGMGLSLPLKEFDVSPVPGATTLLLSSPEKMRWSMREVDVAEAYVATVAVEGHGVRIGSWDWPEYKAATKTR